MDDELSPKILQILFDAAKAINSLSGRDEILAKITEYALKVVEFGSGSFSHIALLENGKLFFIAAYPPAMISELQDAGSVIDIYNPTVIKKGIAGRAILEKKILNISDVTIHPDYVGYSKWNIKSELAVPLILMGGHIIGVLSIEHPNQSTFSETDETNLKMLADLAAIAIENAQTRQYIQSLISSTDEPKEVLQIILDYVRTTLNAQSVVIRLANEYGKLVERYAAGIIEQRVATTEPRPSGISESVYLSGEAQFFEDVEKSKDIVNPELINAGIKAAACLPLSVRGKNIGILWMRYTGLHPFPESEREALKLFASQAAIAYNKVSIREADRIATEVSAKGDLTDTIKALVKWAWLSLDCDVVTINDYDATRQRFDSRDFDRRVSYGVRNKVIPQQGIRPDSILRTIVALKDNYLEVPDISKHLLTKKSIFAEEEGIKCGLYIPLRFEEGGEKKVVGILCINYRSKHTFTEREISKALQFAKQAAITINNHQLYEQAENRRKNFEKLQDAIVELNKLNDLDRIFQKITDFGRTFVAEGANADEYFSHFALKIGTKLRWVTTTPSNMLGELQKGGQYIDLEKTDHRLSITGLAAIYKTTQNVPDVSKDNYYIQIRPNIKSQLSVPFILNDEVIGVMSIEHSERSAFTKEDETILELLAAQAAITISNTRRAKTLETLNKAAELINNTSLNKEQTLSQITAQAIEVTSISKKDGWFSYVIIVDKAKMELQYLAANNNENLEMLRRDVEPYINLKNNKPTIAGRAALLEKVQNIGNVAESQDHIGLVETYRKGSTLAVPIKFSDDKVLVLTVRHLELNAFTDQDVEGLKSLAKLAVTALKNAELMEETTRKERAEKALNIAAQEIAKDLELNPILEVITKQALTVLGNDAENLGAFSHIALVEYDTLYFNNVYPSNAWKIERPNRDLSKDGQEIGITGKAAKFKTTQCIQDVSQDSYYFELNPNVKSQLSVPILEENTILGVLSIEHPEKGAFSKEDIEIIESLAALAALAISNAQLYQIKSKSLQIQTTLIMKSMEFATWGHSLPADLQAVSIRISSCRLLLNKLEMTSLNNLKEHLDEAEKVLTNITHNRFAQGIIKDPESIFINFFVEKWVQRHTSSLHSNWKFILDCNPELNTISIKAHETLLERVLEILCQNAIKSFTDISEPTVTLRTSYNQGNIEIHVIDNGKGIPIDLQQIIFKQPIEKKDGEEGLGIGLYMVSIIIEHYGGNVRFETGEHGTDITLSFPTTI